MDYRRRQLTNKQTTTDDNESLSEDEMVGSVAKPLADRVDDVLNPELEEETVRALDKLFRHMVQHSRSSVRRAERTLLLANSGALALWLSVAKPSLVSAWMLAPAVAFTIGVFCAGVWAVVDGFTVLGMRAIVNKPALRRPAMKVMTDRMNKEVGGTIDWAAVDLEEKFPAEELKDGATAGPLLLGAASLALVVGVIWGYGLMFSAVLG